MISDVTTPLCSNTEGRSWLCKYFIGWWCTGCHRLVRYLLRHIRCYPRCVASHVVPKSFPGSFCWIALFQQLDSSLGTLSTSSQNLSLSSLLALVASQLASGSGMHQAGHTDRLRASWVEATGANVERRSLPVTTIAAPHLSRLRRSLCFTSSSRSSDRHCPGAVCNIILVSSTDGSWSYDLHSCSFCEIPATSPNKVLPWIVQDLETSLATRASR